MNNNLALLRTLLPFVESPAFRIDWSQIETEIDSLLPLDYKEMIDFFGGGLIDDYMLLLEPNSPHHAYDLKRVIGQRYEANDILWDLEPPPHEVSEMNARLIPWATTDNGEYLYWAALADAPQRNGTYLSMMRATQCGRTTA